LPRGSCGHEIIWRVTFGKTESNVDWLNYHHLYYFWVVAQEGGVSAAGRRLRLAPSTVSAQLRELEVQLGSPLLVRTGRTVVLTEVGRTVFRYAERIFALGRELHDAVRDAVLPVTWSVGVSDAIPKLLACQLLEGALGAQPPCRMVVREGRPDRLAAELVLDELDLVLSDAPVSLPRTANALLGESGVTFFAVASLAQTLSPDFPAALDRAEVLLPLAGTPLRRALEQWFAASGIRPVVAGEFEDGALLQVFGQRGAGVFPALSVVEDVVAQAGVAVVGRVPTIRIPYFAITSDRSAAHPLLAPFLARARARLGTV
jgi:LysR family transcriptional activator of nhaA